MTTSSIMIAGMPFVVETVEKLSDVCHDDSGAKLWGQICYQRHSIRIARATPERELRSMLHEVLHGIIQEYRIRELMDENGNHLEFPIDQLSIGLAEALESVGISVLSRRRKV